MMFTAGLTLLLPLVPVPQMAKLMVPMGLRLSLGMVSCRL